MEKITENPVSKFLGERNLGRGDLATLLGCSPALIGAWERGESKPTTARLGPLTIYGVNPARFVAAWVAWRNICRERLFARVAAEIEAKDKREAARVGQVG